MQFYGDPKKMKLKFCNLGLPWRTKGCKLTKIGQNERITLKMKGRFQQTQSSNDV